MTTITHRHSRPHHNDEPTAFVGLDAEARASAAEVIATATSAEYASDRPLAELSQEELAATTTPPEYVMRHELVDLGRLAYHGRRMRRGAGR